MTVTELNKIEDDLKRYEAKFPNGYGAMKAFELIEALRPFITETEKETEKEAPNETL